MEITRIFDIVRRYGQLYPEQDTVFSWKQDGVWLKMDAKTYVSSVDIISSALLELGVQPGDKVGIISPSRPEWNIADYAAMQIGAVSVPVYATISQEDYRHIFSVSEMCVAFVEGKELQQKVEPLFAELPALKHVITMLPHPESDYQSYQDLYRLGEEHLLQNLPRIALLRESVQPAQLATLIFTSGTTGLPKGVMLSHSNLVMQVLGVAGIPDGTSRRALSFLPLCHAYERLLVYYYQYAGISVYYGQNVGTIGQDIQATDPNIMTCVPRVLEKVYDRLVLTGRKLPVLQRTVFFAAMRHAERFNYENKGPAYKAVLRLYDRLVYKKLREAIGGHFEIVVSGGSALQPKLASFFSAIGMPIIEGYGLSETSPVITVSRKGLHERRPGCVGVALPGVELRISDEGEVLCRGGNVMMGYYQHPELTAEVIDSDGWFHTGDTGRLSPEGLLSITGRLKSLFKTSLGKYINPELIETRLTESPFISQMMVMGEYQRYAAALISPDFAYIRTWGKSRKLHFDTNEDICNSKEVRREIEREIAHLSGNFGTWEKIHKFTLVPEEWTDHNFLSPTLKVKRKAVMEAYKDEISRFW